MRPDAKNIYFENDDFVVVNKAAGILSIPDRYEPSLIAMSTLLKRHYGAIWTVHRIDRDTSGLMVFAKHPESHKILNNLFFEGKVHKEYLALVNGSIKEDSGIIETPMNYNNDKKKVIEHKKGKSGVTKFEVVERFKQFSYLKMKLETGRIHQARFHLQSIFHPLMVDKKYGSRESFLLSEIKRKRFNLQKEQAERPLLTRHPLHASRLSFTFNNEKFDFDLKGDLPKDMKATLNQLRKLNKLKV